MGSSNINNSCPIKKSKRIDTIMKKASELSILCDIDVCLVGSRATDESSGPSQWITWPEDQNEVARIVDRYKEKIKEKKGSVKASDGSGKGQGQVKSFDVDKALEGMSFEKVNSVRDRVSRMVAEIDAKLDGLKKKENSSDISTTPMGFGLSLQQTLGIVGNSDESMLVDDSPPLDRPQDLGLKAVDTCPTPMLSGFPLCQTMGEVASSDQIHQAVKNAAETLDMQNELVSEVAYKGVKIFGVFMSPKVSSVSAQPATEPKA